MSNEWPNPTKRSRQYAEKYAQLAAMLTFLASGAYLLLGDTMMALVAAVMWVGWAQIVGGGRRE